MHASLSFSLAETSVLELVKNHREKFVVYVDTVYPGKNGKVMGGDWGAHREYTYEEIRSHNHKDDAWIVVGTHVMSPPAMCLHVPVCLCVCVCVCGGDCSNNKSEVVCATSDARMTDALYSRVMYFDSH
jgi:hypothetical protein